MEDYENRFELLDYDLNFILQKIVGQVSNTFQKFGAQDLKWVKTVIWYFFDTLFNFVTGKEKL